jgi:hypothetical protein
MPKWFDTLEQQKKAERENTTAVESVRDIPKEASAEHGWALSLTIKKITPRVTVNGQAYYWLLVRDKSGHAFSVVVWGYQWDDLGPFEEGGKKATDGEGAEGGLYGVEPVLNCVIVRTILMKSNIYLGDCSVLHLYSNFAQARWLRTLLLSQNRGT